MCVAVVKSNSWACACVVILFLHHSLRYSLRERMYLLTAAWRDRGGGCRPWESINRIDEEETWEIVQGTMRSIHAST